MEKTGGPNSAPPCWPSPWSQVFAVDSLVRKARSKALKVRVWTSVQPRDENWEPDEHKFDQMSPCGSTSDYVWSYQRSYLLNRTQCVIEYPKTPSRPRNQCSHAGSIRFCHGFTRGCGWSNGGPSLKRYSSKSPVYISFRAATAPEIIFCPALSLGVCAQRSCLCLFSFFSVASSNMKNYRLFECIVVAWCLQ